MKRTKTMAKSVQSSRDEDQQRGLPKSSTVKLAASPRLTVGTQTGSFVNHITSGYADAAPKVGAGATILHWTDRTAVTVVAVRLTKKGAPKEVDVQHDVATRTDTNGMSESQSYSYAPDPKGAIETFSIRKNGAWVRLGDSMSGTRLKIGARHAYHDYSF